MTWINPQPLLIIANDLALPNGWLAALILLLPLSVTVSYYVMIGWWALRARSGENRRALEYQLGLFDGREPAVSVIIPAHNEADVIVASLRNVMEQDYRAIEIIVIDDRSEDGTAAAINEAFELVESGPLRPGPIPNEATGTVLVSPDLPLTVIVLDENEGRKATAMNVGINMAQHPYVVLRDADGLLERDTISRCMTEVVNSEIPVIAVGASLLPSNDCVVTNDSVTDNQVSRRPLVGVQLIEYVAAFFLCRPGMSSDNTLPFVSGGFGLFLREGLVGIRGLTSGHLGEDLDLCLRLHRHYLATQKPYRMAMVPEAVVWTEVPETLSDLRTQRYRWQWGFQECVQGHRDMLFSRSYGRVGWVGYGYLHIFEWWGLFLELGTWALALLLAVLGVVPIATVALALLIAQLVAMIAMALAVQLSLQRVTTLDGSANLARLALWTVLFSFIYRPITTTWRAKSLLAVDRGWGQLSRRGFQTADLEASR